MHIVLNDGGHFLFPQGFVCVLAGSESPACLLRWKRCEPTNKDKVFGGRRRTEEKTTSVREAYVCFFPVAGRGLSGEHAHIFHHCPVPDF